MPSEAIRRAARATALYAIQTNATEAETEEFFLDVLATLLRQRKPQTFDIPPTHYEPEIFN